MLDAAGFEVEGIDAGNSPGPVDDLVGVDRLGGAVMFEGDPKSVADPHDFVDRNAGLHVDADPLAFLPDRGDGAKGVLPRVLKNIISKRREVKGLLKKEKNVKKRETYEIRQVADSASLKLQVRVDGVGATHAAARESRGGFVIV